MNKLASRLIFGSAAAIVMTSSASAFLFGRESDRAQETLSQYERTGETVTCLSLHNIRDTDAVDDYTLLVEAPRGEMYINELNNRCIGLAREQRYVHKTSQNQLCRGDIIQVMDSFGNPLGSCGLGDFEKLSKIENPES